MSDTPEPVPVIIPCEMVWQGMATSIGAGTHPYEEVCGKPSTERILVENEVGEEDLYDACSLCAEKAVDELNAIIVKPVAG